MKTLFVLLSLIIGIVNMSAAMITTDQPGVYISPEGSDYYSLEMWDSSYTLYNPEKYVFITMYGDSSLTMYGQDLFLHNQGTDKYNFVYDRYNQGYITGKSVTTDKDYCITLGNFSAFMYPSMYPKQNYENLIFKEWTVPEPTTIYLYASLMFVLGCKNRKLKL